MGNANGRGNNTATAPLPAEGVPPPSLLAPSPALHPAPTTSQSALIPQQASSSLTQGGGMNLGSLAALLREEREYMAAQVQCQRQETERQREENLKLRTAATAAAELREEVSQRLSHAIYDISSHKSVCCICLTRRGVCIPRDIMGNTGGRPHVSPRSSSRHSTLGLQWLTRRSCSRTRICAPWRT